MEKVGRTGIVLNSHGFELTHDVGELPGRVVAVNQGTFHHDFLAYPISGVAKTRFGHRVILEPDTEVIFYDEHETGLECVRQSGLELFIPDFLMREFGVYVGDELPAATEADPMKLGWKWPPKQVVTAEDIIAEHGQEYYDTLVSFIEKRKLPPEELERRVAYIESMIDYMAVEASVETRTKTPEGLHGAVQRGIPGRNLDEIIPDVNGIRIIADSADECFLMLYTVFDRFPFGVWRDHISMPKPNGFQFLQAYYPPEESIDLQVQTRAMRERGENGTAANYRQER